MNINIKQKEDNIISTISTFKTNRNPISLFFAIADLKELFINIWESLLTNIEQKYTWKAKNEYLSIVWEFKKEWIFEVSYNHYINNHWLSRFRESIDDYFEHSFFTDISFFYFTLSRIWKYKFLFKSLESFYNSSDIKNNYFSLDWYISKKEFLINNIDWIESLKTDSEFYFIVKFLDKFINFDLSQIEPSFNNWITADIKVIKNITLYVFWDNNNDLELKKLFINEFLDNKQLYSKVIENFEEEKIFEVISFLRKDLISHININSTLDYKSKKLVIDYADIAYKISEKNIDDKISFLLNKERDFKNMKEGRGDFARITFKRLLLEKKYPYLIDLTLWITSLPQDVFHLYKQKTQSLDLETLKLYTEIKDLILFIDKSFFLNLAKPFILRKVAHYFNSSDQKYYIIKFILCVVLPNSYSEYKKVSKFFYNLESFQRKNLESRIWRMMQYWWLYILVFLLFFIAPFWVLIAGLIFFIKDMILKIISKINPKIKMNLNFQIWWFASSLWVVAVLLWGTVWYKDNINSIYENFRWTINAITLPANESLRLIASDLSFLKTDLLNFNNLDSNLWSIYDIDYRKGITLTNLKGNVNKNDDFIYQDNEDLVNDRFDEFVFRIDANNTFWDYANMFARRCWINTNSIDYDKFILDSIEKFLLENRSELLKYINTWWIRLSVWTMAKRLPAIDYNLESLYRNICD